VTVGIYVDINATWGPADELVIIDDSRWGADDYAEMGVWTDRMVLEYSETHEGMTPTEWVSANYPDLVGSWV
jgi:hypothetical protein